MKVALDRYCFCTIQRKYRLKASPKSFFVSSARMAAVSKAGYLYDRYSESGLMLPQQLSRQLFLRQDSCKLVQMVFLHGSYSSSEIRSISVDTLSMPFPKENSMTIANRQCREFSIATGCSLLRTPLTKGTPVIMKSESSYVSRRKNLFWRLSGRGSISRSPSGIPGWIKP